MGRDREPVSGTTIPIAEVEVHLRDYLKVLRRRWVATVAVWSAIFLAISLFTIMQPPLYQADTLLQVAKGSKTPAILTELTGLSSAPGAVETEIEIIKSRSLGSEIVKTLGMDVVVMKSGRNFLTRLHEGLIPAETGKPPLPKVAFLKTSLELSNRELQLRLDADGQSFTVLCKGKKLAKGQLGQKTSGSGIEIEIHASGALPPKAAYIVIQKDIRKATSDLIGKLRISQVGRNTGVIRVAYRSQDPLQAASVLETLNRLYIHQDIEETSKEALAILDFITGQLTFVKTNLGEAQDRLDQYKVRTGAIALSQEAELLVQRISDLEVETNLMEVRGGALSSILKAVEEGSPSAASGMVVLDIESRELADLIADHSALQRKKTELLKEYTPENPALMVLEDQISLVSGQIKNNAAAVLEVVKRRDEAVREVLQSYRKQLLRLPELERTLAKLQGDVLLQEKIYSFFLEKEQETRIIKASAVSSIRIIDPPSIPVDPIRPRTARNLLLGLAIGLALGIGITFFMEYLDDTIKEPEELEAWTGVPVYGNIPFVKKAFERRKAKKPHLVMEEPRSFVAESFRTLRTNIAFSRAQTQIITVTSSQPGDGKSFLVANLGAISALAGRRTLVVDCDLRNPQQQIVFGNGITPGITDILTGRCSMDEAVRQTKVENLAVVHSGVLPPNPAELLGSTAMVDFLDECRKRYELILLDSPPVVMVTDASLLLRHSDLGLMVAMVRWTPLDLLRRGIYLIQNQVPGLQIGVVVNGIREKKSYGRSKYRYGY